MSNLVDWLTSAANGKEIIGVVIGEMGWGGYGSEAIPNYEAIPKNKVLSWEVAKTFLNYEFDAGYGAPGCQAVYAWTEDHVIFISQYDGSTNTERVPRNPIDCIPDMPGG